MKFLLTLSELLSPLIAIIGLIFLYMQIRAIKIQLKMHYEEVKITHDRDSRQYGITLLNEWSERQNEATARVVKFVGKLKESDCKSIFKNENFRIIKNDENKDLSAKALGEKFPDFIEMLEGPEDYIEIPAKYSAYIRFHAVHYLNITESVLSAWYWGIVPEEMFKKQFSFLNHDDSDIKNMREAAKNVSGQEECFPCIQEFLKMTRPDSSAKKPPFKNFTPSGVDEV